MTARFVVPHEYAGAMYRAAMAVYLFTFHAYRSWRPDDPRGYVKRGEGIQASDEQMADWYDRDAKHDAVRFDTDAQNAIVEATRSLAEKCAWRLHYVCATATHVHVLLSWRQYQDWNAVRTRIKRDFGRVLSKSLNKPGPWFSRGGKDSRKRVRGREHFDYLMHRYLPKCEPHGWHFREGNEAPWRIG